MKGVPFLLKFSGRALQLHFFAIQNFHDLNLNRGPLVAKARRDVEWGWGMEGCGTCNDYCGF